MGIGKEKTRKAVATLKRVSVEILITVISTVIAGLILHVLIG